MERGPAQKAHQKWLQGDGGTDPVSEEGRYLEPQTHMDWNWPLPLPGKPAGFHFLPERPGSRMPGMYIGPTADLGLQGQRTVP